MSQEKDRRTKRAMVERDVVINGITKAEALDISIEGMYIYTQASFIPGTIFEVDFKVNNIPIVAMVRVQHAQPKVGVGVQFIELSRESSDIIKKYVEEDLT